MAKYVDETTTVIDNTITSLKLTLTDNSFTVDEQEYLNRKINTLRLQRQMYVKAMRKDIKTNAERKPSSFLLNMRKTLDILNSI